MTWVGFLYNLGRAALGIGLGATIVYFAYEIPRLADVPIAGSAAIQHIAGLVMGGAMGAYIGCRTCSYVERSRE